MSARDIGNTGNQGERGRREHGGAPTHVDDDALAQRTEQERVDAGVEDYNPDDVPAATDEGTVPGVTQSEEYQEESAEIRRETEEGESYPLTDKHPFPPSHYGRS